MLGAAVQQEVMDSVMEGEGDRTRGARPPGPSASWLLRAGDPKLLETCKAMKH